LFQGQTSLFGVIPRESLQKLLDVNPKLKSPKA